MRIEDVTDLNELNVKKFLKYIKARPDDEKENLDIAFAYVDEKDRIDSRTKIYFAIDRYEQQRDRIASMLGQLKKIHDREKSLEKNNRILDFIDLQTKYDGTKWTEDPNCTIFLYWLGNFGNYFAGFEKGEDGIYRANLDKSARRISPMESPSDPDLAKRFHRSR